MSEKGEQTQKKGTSRLILGIILIIILIIVVLLFFGSASGIASVADKVSDIAGGVADSANIFDGDPVETSKFVSNMHIITLRDSDFAVSYKHSKNSRLSNDELLGLMTIEAGKTYLIQTGRVDGWDTYIEKLDNKDIGPSFYQTRVEIFETVEGAELAFSPEWLWVYTNIKRAPDEILDDNCEFGDECLYLSYVDTVPGSTIVNVRWDYVFRYKNIIAWVYVKGSDIETFEQDANDAAQLVYDRILALE